MTKDLKFVPNAPKTYEVKYVEIKEPTRITKLAGYLGIGTVYNCTKPEKVVHVTTTTTSSSTTVSTTPSTQAEIVASAIETTSKVGGSVEIKTETDGKTTVNYDSGKTAK